jgi:hypothetical protein
MLRVDSQQVIDELLLLYVKGVNIRGVKLL